MDRATAPAEETATGELVTAAVTDRCSNCQAPLASDQRYCINCGERRGKQRFTFAADQPQQATASMPKQPRQGGRSTGAVALVGFIAVLLLAMGVGVLIGHGNNGNTSTKVASTPAPEVITVNGGGTASASTSNSNSKSSSKKKGKSGSSSSSGSKSKVSKSTANAAAAAAGNAYGGGGSKISDPTVQPGQAATGPGTQNGKFTGNFFP